MCKTIPLEAPWEAKNADKWDSITLAKWLDHHVPSKAAHDLLETAIARLLHLRRVGGFDAVRALPDGVGRRTGVRVRRQGRLPGLPDRRRHGRGLRADGRRDRRLAAPVAAGAADRPGRRRRDGALRRHDRAGAARRSSRCRSPSPAKSSTSQCFPSTGRSCTSACRAAPIYKINIVYDEPFWRADGLSGQSAAPGTPAPVTIDASTDAGTPGRAVRDRRGADRASDVRSSTRRSADELILAELVERFGDKAASPVDYIEQNWTTERYSGGGMLSHAPPGVLTEFGPALREPCGRIHWAGTESSAVMCGWVDGAVRSGERAAIRGDATRTSQHGVTVGCRRGTTRYDNRSDRIQSGKKPSMRSAAWPRGTAWPSSSGRSDC